MKLKDYLFVECYYSQEKNFIQKMRCRQFPQVEAVYLIRKMQFAKSKRVQQRYYFKLIKKYGIDCSPNAQIGLGLQIPHPTGIIIGGSVVLGTNVKIYQQVTLGSARVGEYKEGKQPNVGNDCVLFAGAKILGPIKVAEGTIVGANAVLTKNTEPNSTWIGVPAKPIIKKLEG